MKMATDKFSLGQLATDAINVRDALRRVIMT